MNHEFDKVMLHMCEVLKIYTFFQYEAQIVNAPFSAICASVQMVTSVCGIIIQDSLFNARSVIIA